jgi:crotonobetainyl-CoA:carnitine CoA-transferase CaiB-like acyl-CoA transferase
MRDPQLAARGLFGEVTSPWEGKALPALATPVRVDGARPPFRPAPALGADTDDVLRQAGFAAEEVAALRARGAVGGVSPPPGGPAVA